MGTNLSRLSSQSVRYAGPGRHQDGDGLYLEVRPTGARFWLLRVQVDGRRRDIGLGRADIEPRRPEQTTILQDVPILQRRSLTLAEAREKSALLRRLAKSGRDPVEERDKDRRTSPTFKEAAEQCHATMKGGWSEKNAAAFLRSLSEHAYPKLGKMRVNAIDAAEITDALAPIWTTKPEQARKVRQRIGVVLNFSKNRGWRDVEAPTRTVTMGLPKRPTGGNYSAMPWATLPAFVAELAKRQLTASRLALLFAIATAARSGEVRSARLSHIDWENALWHRPAALMKNKLAHTVTLSPMAIAILRAAVALFKPEPAGLLFPSTRGGMLSDMAISKVMRDSKQNYVPHGFRSSFRDWSAEQQHEIPDPVAEAALAHVVPDKVVRAYKRTTFLAMRRQLLDAWGRFLMPSGFDPVPPRCDRTSGQSGSGVLL